MSDAQEWAGHHAWVTGGQRGIGLAFARAFARRGASVHISARDPHSEGAVAALAELSAAGAGHAEAHPLDLGDEDSLAGFSRLLRNAPPRVLVHSAHAFSAHTPIVALKPAQLEAGLRVNVVGAFSVLRAAARAMRRSGGGRIVIVGSLASQVGGVGQASYIAEKAALTGLTLAFASEFGRDGVSCNVVHPGIVDTENVRERVPAAARDAFAALTTRGRLLTVDDVVSRALPLLDPNAPVPNGESWLIADGAEGPLREHLLTLGGPSGASGTQAAAADKREPGGQDAP